MTQSVATIVESFRARTPRSRELYEGGASTRRVRPREAYYYRPYPLSMDRGEGSRLWDVDGNEYLDCAYHYTAQVLGHNHPSSDGGRLRPDPQGLGRGRSHGDGSPHRRGDVPKGRLPGSDPLRQFRNRSHPARDSAGPRVLREDEDRQVRRGLSRQS